MTEKIQDAVCPFCGHPAHAHDYMMGCRSEKCDCDLSFIDVVRAALEEELKRKPDDNTQL